VAERAAAAGFLQALTYLGDQRRVLLLLAETVCQLGERASVAGRCYRSGEGGQYLRLSQVSESLITCASIMLMICRLAANRPGSLNSSRIRER
jgi:hypothetical protein